MGSLAGRISMPSDLVVGTEQAMFKALGSHESFPTDMRINHNTQ